MKPLRRHDPPGSRVENVGNEPTTGSHPTGTIARSDQLTRPAVPSERHPGLLGVNQSWRACPLHPPPQEGACGRTPAQVSRKGNGKRYRNAAAAGDRTLSCANVREDTPKTTQPGRCVIGRWVVELITDPALS